MKKVILLNLIVLLLTAALAPAATRLVPDEYATIQAAIDAAVDGDVVIIAPGTYTGEGNRDIDFLGKAITVRSENGPENCIIDCNGTQADPHRGFYFHSDEDANSVLDGVTITGGYAYQGGGIRCDKSSPTIRRCIITKNISGWGGGIRCFNSNAVIDNCLIAGNKGWDTASGINCRESRPTINNCTIIGNWVSGVFCQESRPTLTNCILWNNFPQQIRYRHGWPSSIAFVTYSDVQGGWRGEGNIDADSCFVQPGYWDVNGVWVEGDYHLLTDSPCIDSGDPDYIAEPNETDLDGKPRVINGIVDMGAYEFGRIWYVDAVDGDDDNDGLSPETAFATIQKGINTAEDGSEVLVYPGVYTEAINFLGKAITVKSAKDAAVLEASDYFAVLFHSGEGHHSILKNFVVRNSFIAIFIDGSSPTISNVTVADNGFGIAAYAGAEPDISNSIFWNNIYGDLFGCEARYSCIQEAGEGQGNLDIDPLFADSENGDYHLLSRRGRYWPEHNVWVLDDVISPCIDGGDPNADYFNEPKPNGGRVNMGAYGGTAYASMKEMRWVHSDINHDGWVNMIDFAVLAKNWLKYNPGTSNLPPEVAIMKPQDGDGFRREETIEIEADSWDADGLVKKVEFFANGSNIDEDTDGVDGWKIYWMEHPLRTYSLTAEATDDDGATTTSPAVEIQIDLR